MTSTFWGLRLEPGKRYSTTVDKSFHVSMAALDCSTVKNDKDVQSVMLEEGESNIPFILCNLQKPKVLQSRLDLNFMSGDRVTFFCRGNGTVHLTGYIMPDDDDDFANFGDEEEGEEVEEEEEEEDDEETEEKDKEIEAGKGKAKLNGLPAKRKGDTDVSLPPKKKKQELQNQNESEDSDEDEDVEEEDDDDDSGEEEEDGGEEIEEEESEEESEEENEDQEEVKKTTPPANLEKKSKKKKKNKQDQQTPNAQQQQQQQGKQKQQNAGLQQQKKKPQQQGQAGAEKQSTEGQPKKTLEGGVIIKDIKMGSGPLCKPGRMATVYYTGRLKSNNKVFDQSQHGPGFKFRVGRGEVIKGWDIGLTGMKVGGKRLITCPPNVAYGQKGSPPTIPANSTLVFEVELKAVN